jgi:hypothetical protein
MDIMTDETNAEYPVDEPEIIESEERAEEHLRKLAYWNTEMERINAHAQAEMDKIAAWKESEVGKVQSKIQWHEQGLQGFLWRSGAKTINLINGKLKRIKGRDRVEIPDIDAFVGTAPGEFLNVKTIPDKTSIMAHIKETGEIPEGVDLVTGEDSFKVSLA